MGGDATTDGDDVVLDAPAASSARGSSTCTPTCASPGREEAETIETGSRGRGARRATRRWWRCRTPSRRPTRRGVVELVRALGERAGLCDVHPSGCITVGRAGEALAPYAELVAAGVRLFTDDGDGVQDPLLMRRAMEYSAGLDMVLAQHCEVAALTGGAVMHEGRCCSDLGVPGWPARGRGADGAPRHRAVPADRRPAAPSPPVDGTQRRPGAAAPRPRACP